MNSRLQALIDRGYSEEEVLALSSYNEEDIDYAVDMAFNHISRNCKKISSPKAFFIGGQPGCGKSVFSMKIKNQLKNILEIGIDNYRMYHPNYLKIEKCIKKHWQGKIPNENDSPGNDIADFTHFFAGDMTDRLIDRASIVDENAKAYNLAIEWGMRTPEGPLESMEELSNKGYDVNVMFIVTPKENSMDACNLRADVMKESQRIIRKVPRSFHDLSVSTLPNSLKTILEKGKEKNIINSFSLVERSGEIIWDLNDSRDPMKVYEDYLNNGQLNKFKDNSVELSKETTKNELIGIYKTLSKIKQSQESTYYFSAFDEELIANKSK